jgi:hypothetical protein
VQIIPPCLHHAIYPEQGVLYLPYFYFLTPFSRAQHSLHRSDGLGPNRTPRPCANAHHITIRSLWLILSQMLFVGICGNEALCQWGTSSNRDTFIIGRRRLPASGKSHSFPAKVHAGIYTCSLPHDLAEKGSSSMQSSIISPVCSRLLASPKRGLRVSAACTCVLFQL